MAKKGENMAWMRSTVVLVSVACLLLMAVPALAEEDVEILTEDQDAVDLIKADLQAELDAKAREEELLAIAIAELKE